MYNNSSVDINDIQAFTIYPFLALGAIELISRVIKISSWKKLSVQGVSMIILSVIYVVSPSMIVTQENNVHVEPLWMSILVMLALAATLFYQARRSKIDPSKAEY